MLLYLIIGEFNLSMFVVLAKHLKYNGHSLYQINVSNTKEMEIVNNLVNHMYLDEWSRAVPGRSGNILVPKESKDVFEISLIAGGLKYKIKVHNIRDLLILEDQHLKSTAATRNQHQKGHRKNFKILFNTVYTYEEINAYLEYLAKTYSYVENVKGGESIEERPIYYLKISSTKFQDNKKPIVMLQSLIHAREWTSLPVTLYAIHNLVTKVEPDLLDNIDWIIVPVVNPDGYVYTHKEDRMWRKNRRPAICTGVDLNRNFQFLWGVHSSSFSCSNNFHGERPMSEPETRVIDEIIIRHKNRIALYLDIHSYGSLILYPYGDGTLPQNHHTINEVGVLMGQTIDQVKLPWNPNYTVGNIASILYKVSGSASDYARSMRIPLSYIFELVEGDGFLVDNKTIEHICNETWQAISAGARYILNKDDLSHKR